MGIYKGLMMCGASCATQDETQRRASYAKKEQKRINYEIEKELRLERRRMTRQHRILLLGCGEAGKSTFIKQMRIIHSGGFTLEERLDMKREMIRNVISAIQTLVKQLDVFGLSGNKTDNANDDISIGYDGTPPGSDNQQQHQEDMEIISQLNPFIEYPEEFTHEIAASIARVWNNQEIQLVFRKRNHYQLVESAPYFLNKVEELSEVGYIMSDQDILQTRVRTTGIIEHEFQIFPNNQMPRKMILIDVGGQRSERRKWIHCFEDVTLLLFLTAISEYDQVLAEDNKTNRMKESLRLFQAILDYDWFKKTNVILFLNKKDILEQKVVYSPIANHFPEFSEDVFGNLSSQSSNDAEHPQINPPAVPVRMYDRAVNFFMKKFYSVNPNPNERHIYSHVTCATDTQNIKVVDVAVQEHVWACMLKDVYLD